MQKLSLMLIITFMFMIMTGAAIALDIEFDDHVNEMSETEIRLSTDVLLVEDNAENGDDDQGDDLEDDNDDDDADGGEDKENEDNDDDAEAVK